MQTNSTLAFLLSLLVTATAQANALTAAVKVGEKIAAHSADNVAEKVIVHNADDAAKLAAKCAGKAAAHTVPAVERAVARSVEVAQAEARAARPAVEAAARKPLVRPGTIVAGGAAVGTVVAANNATDGMGDERRSRGHAVENHPEILPDVLRAEGETGIRNKIGENLGAGIYLILCVCGGVLALYSIPGLIRRFRSLHRPEEMDKSQAPESDKQAA